MKQTILIIDDDDALRNTLAAGLCAAGFNVITAGSAEHATEVLKRIAPDAVVLDRMMTGKDGLSALLEWRAAGEKTPILMLTALAGTENTIDGLSGGADDYLVKPFQLKELILRLNNIIQRNSAYVPRMPENLNFIDGEFFIGNKLLALSMVEKDILCTLIRPIGNTVMAPAMVIKRLREKLKLGTGLGILTVRGRGYKIITHCVQG